MPTSEDDPVESSSSSVRYGAFSKVGFIRMVTDKVNQDSHWELAGWKGKPALHYFGVADGHGVFGHLVSSMITKQLPIHLSKELDQAGSAVSEMKQAF